jgi:hypothetical protein
MNSDRTLTNTKVKQRTLFKKEIYKLTMTTQNIKEEWSKNMENFRNKKRLTNLLQISLKLDPIRLQKMEKLPMLMD